MPSAVPAEWNGCVTFPVGVSSSRVPLGVGPQGCLPLNRGDLSQMMDLGKDASTGLCLFFKRLLPGLPGLTGPPAVLIRPGAL